MLMLRLNDFSFLLQDGTNNDDSDSGTESDEEEDCKGMLLFFLGYIYNRFLSNIE